MAETINLPIILPEQLPEQLPEIPNIISFPNSDQKPTENPEEKLQEIQTSPVEPGSIFSNLLY